jgi:hypothetical protein
MKELKKNLMGSWTANHIYTCVSLYVYQCTVRHFSAATVVNATGWERKVTATWPTPALHAPTEVNIGFMTPDDYARLEPFTLKKKTAFPGLVG